MPRRHMHDKIHGMSHMHYNGICDSCRFKVIVKHDDMELFDNMHWFQMHEKVKIQINGK
jgi:hypothetical protein